MIEIYRQSRGIKFEAKPNVKGFYEIYADRKMIANNVLTYDEAMLVINQHSRKA